MAGGGSGMAGKRGGPRHPPPLVFSVQEARYPVPAYPGTRKGAGVLQCVAPAGVSPWRVTNSTGFEPMDSIVGEVWRPAAGFKGCYEVSNMGRVRSVDRDLLLSNGQVRHYKGRIRQPRITNYGYHHYGLYVGLVRYQVSAHRLVLETFVGPCPEGMECLHGDGNPSNNRLDNLKWGTDAENQADRVRHGTDSRGEKHGAAIYTEETIKAIRADYANSMVQRRIAEKYGIDFRYVNSIVKNKCWKHI